MSYEKHHWTTGEKITPAALNNIEQGLSEGNVFMIEVNNNVLNKTYAEIKNAFFKGKKCILFSNGMYELVSVVKEYSDEFCINNIFISYEYNGYPAMQGAD